MPRVGDVFQLLSGTLAVPNTTIQSAPYNAQQNDWVLEANTARPISAGGTGSTTAAGARTSLGAIGAGDLAAAATKAAPVGTDSVVIIDSEDTDKNKRWLVSDIRTSFAVLTDTNFTLVSTDAGAGVGPALFLDRLSTSPEDNDLGGTIQFRGKTSEATTIVYADMYLQMDDISVDTSGGSLVPTTDGSLVFRTQRAGTLTTALILAPTVAIVNGPLSVAGAITSVSTITSGAGYIATSGNFTSNAVTAILSAGSVNGDVYLRPNGNTSNQMRVEGNGRVTAGGAITSGSTITSGAGFIATSGIVNSATGTLILSTSSASGEIWFRPSNGTTTNDGYYSSAGNLVIAGAGFKPGGGSWTATSDARIKTVHGDYESGLDQILALQPVRYSYKDNGGKEHIGLVAQQAEIVMPELVSQVEGFIDDQAVTDFRMLDPSALIFAAINAIKTLHERLKALEGAPA